MKRIICIFAVLLLFFPCLSEGSSRVLNRQAKADKPGASKIAIGMSVSFDNDGAWYFFAGFKSKSGCPEGFETITVFQYNTKDIVLVKPGVFSLSTRIIKSDECSFNVKDMSFTDGDEVGQWFGVVYKGIDLGISPERHVVTCTDDLVADSFDRFLKKAICTDEED